MTQTPLVNVKIGKAQDLGFDPDGGPWVVLCLRHNTVLNVKSRDAARGFAREITSFCEDCRDNPDSDTPLNVEPDYDFTGNNQDDSDMNATADRLIAEAVAAEAVADEPVVADEPTPIVGTFHASDTPAVHNAASISNMYFRAVCGSTFLMGEPASQDDPGMCEYCAAGTTAPAEPAVKVRKQRVVRERAPKAEKLPKEPKPAREPKPAKEPKVVAVAEPEPEPKHGELARSLYESAETFITAVVADGSVPDARIGVDLLEAKLSVLKAMLPRRKVGRPTGARSGLVRQSASVQPSDELALMRPFAEAGDRRAKDILAHVTAYVPGQDCAFCLERGRSTRHAYATAFCSIGRELRAAARRAE